MGQRLNISIWHKGRLLANSYYHWSAYSLSAAVLTSEAITTYWSINEISPLKIAIKMLESTGAGVNEPERNRIKGDLSGRYNDIDFAPCKSRNAGMLSVTEEGMNETERWEEGRVDVHLDTETVSFSVFHEYSIEECDEIGLDCDTLEVLKYDFSSIPFKEVKNIVQIIEDCPCGFKDSDGFIYRWVG